MVSLIALLIIVVVALLLVQLGANALVLTGMSRSAAVFQAASAFFGVGFTTREAEMVVDHPVRRRIILHLIIAGNIGLTSALATLVVTLVQTRDAEGHFWLTALLFLAGAVAFGLALNIKLVKRPLDALMCRMLTRAGVIRALDYEVLLHVKEGFSVSEVEMWEGHPYAGKALHESRPSDDGLVILGIHRADGTFAGAPDKHVVIHPGDVVMVYGSDLAVKAMREGDARGES
ncbi:TrkA C-terminal domain-containing protein [Luteolibacter marinus]|uniref:TrkA C-terminal domain-containing protein n=1 Tax=Luteolibacter marinus TaxID=2776705 RepID=UPI00186708D5|nr:TrkA C-terminal domain-containing protein [Luteolibacter marinus]